MPIPKITAIARIESLLNKGMLPPLQEGIELFKHGTPPQKLWGAKVIAAWGIKYLTEESTE